jgi:hypothetical protein
VLRKDFTVGKVVSENGLDDPDQNFYENYVCGAARNYGGYCNQEVDALIDRQSIETDPEKRRLLVWEIERKAAISNVFSRGSRAHPAGACRSLGRVAEDAGRSMTVAPRAVSRRSTSSLRRWDRLKPSRLESEGGQDGVNQSAHT